MRDPYFNVLLNESSKLPPRPRQQANVPPRMRMGDGDGDGMGGTTRRDYSINLEWRNLKSEARFSYQQLWHLL